MWGWRRGGEGVYEGRGMKVLAEMGPGGLPVAEVRGLLRFEVWGLLY
jgi:hypothetical protein